MTQASQSFAPTPSRTSEGRAAQVEQVIAPAIEAMGYDIVRVLLSGGRRARLQVMAERRDGAAMQVEDCAEISRAVSAILDVEEPIPGPYDLEVSSPGIDRPLTRLNDFERFRGEQARLELRVPLDGRRRFQGRLLGLDGETIRLETDDGEIGLPFGSLAKAKLVLTEDVIAAAEAGRRTAKQGTK